MKKQKKKQESSSSQTWLLIGAIVLLGAVTWYSIRATDPQSQAGISPPVLVATLSPDLFQGPTRDAYQAARDIPEVLAELPCYCGCDRTAGHEHNLHCYIDNHAAG